MLKVTENIWQVGGDGLTAAGDAAAYLIRFGHQAALIDAGCGSGHWQPVDNISLCLPPDADSVILLLSHCHYDHTGGAARVREQYGCKIIAHEKDALFLEKGRLIGIGVQLSFGNFLSRPPGGKISGI